MKKLTMTVAIAISSITAGSALAATIGAGTPKGAAIQAVTSAVPASLTSKLPGPIKKGDPRLVRKEEPEAKQPGAPVTTSAPTTTKPAMATPTIAPAPKK